MPQWCFIEKTNRRYLIISTGKVFSAYSGDYLKPDVKRGYLYYVKIKFEGQTKQTNVSIKSLLQTYFPNSLKEKSYYMDIEQKQKDDDLLKELKKKGYISK